MNIDFGDNHEIEEVKIIKSENQHKHNELTIRIT
jgi:hypothetical protein